LHWPVAPAGDGHRNGAVRKRSQLKTKRMGEEHYTKRETSAVMADPPLNDNGHTENWPRRFDVTVCRSQQRLYRFLLRRLPQGSPTRASGGTSIAWPSGWSEDRARAWRTEHHLIHPDVRD